MRNTTKLKLILSRYTLCLDLLQNGDMLVNLVSKDSPENMSTIQAKNYSQAISQCYSFYLKQEKVRNKK